MTVNFIATRNKIIRSIYSVLYEQLGCKLSFFDWLLSKKTAYGISTKHLRAHTYESGNTYMIKMRLLLNYKTGLPNLETCSKLIIKISSIDVINEWQCTGGNFNRLNFRSLSHLNRG